MKTIENRDTSAMITGKEQWQPFLVPHPLLSLSRKSIKASRAGTRGFRAPEVLFSVTHQTVGKYIFKKRGTSY
jgi:hypothetical protein